MFRGQQLVYFALCLHPLKNLQNCSAEPHYSLPYYVNGVYDSDESEYWDEAVETKPSDEEMEKHTEREIQDKIKECNTSEEIHCMDLPTGCFGLPQKSSSYEQSLEYFKDRTFHF